MAPDKIWVTTSEMTALLCERRHDYDVAYIRKDALLEWVKEQKTLMGLGGHVSIDDVINKIKSL